MSFVQRIDEIIKGHEANSLAVIGTLAFETSSSFYIFEVSQLLKGIVSEPRRLSVTLNLA